MAEESFGERIVRVEERLQTATSLAAEAVTNQERIMDKLTVLDKKMDEINTDITKYKGFIGGVTLVITGLGVVIAFFKSWLFQKLGIPA